MNELKFRAWDEQGKVMYHNFQFMRSGNEGNDWIVFIADGVSFDSDFKNNPYFAQQLKIMQYTGLKDKNGIEIYDGDIYTVNGVGFYYVMNHYGAFVGGISKDRCMPLGWAVDEDDDGDKEMHTDNTDFLEIVGNIYQNPERLKF